MADVATLRLKVDSHGARAGVMDFERAMDKVTRSAKRAIIAITAYTGVSIKAFSSFEEQMAQVSTMLNQQTMRHMPAYSKAIKGMAIEFGEGTKTLSEGLYNILSASIPAEQAIKTLDVAVRSAKAGITDTGTATYAITGILNAYGLAADKAGRVSDVLFSTVKSGQTTFAQLAPAIGRVTAISSGAGVALEEVSAALATITRGGISTDEAVTGLRQAIISLQGKQEQAVEMAAKHGIELSTEALAAKGLSGVLKDLSVLSVSTINDMFREVEARTAISKLIQDQKGYLGDYEQAMRSAGMTQEAFEKNTNILAQRFRRLWQLVKIVSVEVGEEFAGQMTELTNFILEHKDKIIETAEKAADKLSGFIEFMRNDWRAGIKLGLDASLELFRGFGKSLMVVMEDIFIRLYNNIGVWIERAIAQEIEFGKYKKKFLDELGSRGGALGMYGDKWYQTGGKEGKAREQQVRRQAEQMAAEALQRDMTSGLFETAIPNIDRTPGMTSQRLKQIAEQTKDEIDRIFQESGAGDYTNLSPFEQFAMEADKMLEKMPEVTSETERYDKALKSVTKSTEDFGEASEEVVGEMAGVWRELGFALQDIQYSLSEMIMGIDTLDDFIGNLGKSFQRMFANLASQMAMFGIVSTLFGGGMAGAMGFANPLAGMQNAPLGGLLGSIFKPKASAMGNIISNGRLVPMASGTVLDRPTYFPMADGNVGLAGEAGPELGFFPLRRNRGRLGIDASGGQQRTERPIEVHVKAVLVDDKRAALIEELKGSMGEEIVIKHSIRNRNLLR